MNEEHELIFHAMGSDVRLLIGKPLLASADPAPVAASRERAYIEDFAVRLSRFRADSELSSLNEDPRGEVPASALLRAAVGAGIWAAERSGGLVDPTLTGALERAGYASSLDGCTPAPLRQALACAPPRRPARADPRQLWRRVSVDAQRKTVRRPVGVKLDTGGTGKGLCADAVAHHLRHSYARFVVDCGGDLALGGVGAQLEPFEVEVEHPLSGAVIRTLRLAQGGVATSGLNVRVWQAQGKFAHHLLDPCSGEPAWTGLIGVTALGSSALEAETLSKAALLLGPLGARRVLAGHGGLIVHDSGEVEEIGALDDCYGAPFGAGEAA